MEVGGGKVVIGEAGIVQRSGPKIFQMVVEALAVAAHLDLEMPLTQASASKSASTLRVGMPPI